MNDDTMSIGSYSMLGGQEADTWDLLSVLGQARTLGVQDCTKRVLDWVEESGQVSTALRTCLEQLVVKHRPLEQKRVCAEVLAVMCSQKHDHSALVLIDSALMSNDVYSLVLHSLKLADQRLLSRSSRLCLLLLLCGLSEAPDDVSQLVFGRSSNYEKVLLLAVDLLHSSDLSTAAEAASCLEGVLLPLVKTPGQAELASDAVVQLLQNCAGAAWREGRHSPEAGTPQPDAGAALPSTDRAQLSSRAAHTGCLALLTLLNRFPAMAAREVAEGKGVAALFLLMDARSTSETLACEATDRQTVDLAAACLKAIMDADEQAMCKVAPPNACRVLLARMSAPPTAHSSTSRKALLMLVCLLKQEPAARDELRALGGLPQLTEWVHAEPEQVVQALDSFCSSSQAADVHAVSRCQPALRALVQQLGSADQCTCSRSLLALIKLMEQPLEAPAVVDSGHGASKPEACDPELTARLLEAGIMQQLDRLCSLDDHPLAVRALGVAASLVSTSEEACQQLHQLQQQQQQQLQQQHQHQYDFPQGAPHLCGVLAAALRRLQDQPCAAQLLLCLLQHISNELMRSTAGDTAQGSGAQRSAEKRRLHAAWLLHVATRLFDALPEHKAHPGVSIDPSVLAATATAWNLMDASVCFGSICDDPSTMGKLLFLAIKRAHDPAALCILSKALTATMQLQLYDATTLLGSIAPHLEAALLDLPDGSSSSSSSLVALCTLVISCAARAVSKPIAAPVLRLCCTLLSTCTRLQPGPHSGDELNAPPPLSAVLEQVCHYLQELLSQGRTHGTDSEGERLWVDLNRRVRTQVKSVMLEAAAALGKSVSPDSQAALLTALHTMSMIADAHEQEERFLSQQMEALEGKERTEQECGHDLLPEKDQQLSVEDTSVPSSNADRGTSPSPVRELRLLSISGLHAPPHSAMAESPAEAFEEVVLLIPEELEGDFGNIGEQPSDSRRGDTVEKREEERSQEALQGILNTIAADNHEHLTNKIVEVVKSKEQQALVSLVDMIVEKALKADAPLELLAHVCKAIHLHPDTPKFPSPEGFFGEDVGVPLLLLNKCQEELEKGAQRCQAAHQAADSSKSATRQRMLGNIQFIGFLFKDQLLTERVVQSSIAVLLKEEANPKPEDVECLCNLMSTVGAHLDSITKPEFKTAMDAYFQKMQTLRHNTKLDSRIRSMIQDVLDLHSQKLRLK